MSRICTIKYKPSLFYNKKLLDFTYTAKDKNSFDIVDHINNKTPLIILSEDENFYEVLYEGIGFLVPKEFYSLRDI